MQSSVTLIFILITTIIVLLDKNLESQKEAYEIHKFPTICWVKFTLSSLQWAVRFSLVQPADFCFGSLNVNRPVLSQHSHRVPDFITDFYRQETVG